MRRFKTITLTSDNDKFRTTMRMFKKLLQKQSPFTRRIVFFVGTLWLTGCATQQFPPLDVALVEEQGGDQTPSTELEVTEPPPDPEEFRFRAGDSVSLFVWHNPELSTSAAVRPDGKITIPLINDLHASGKTPMELAEIIEKELTAFVNRPIVTVSVGSIGPAHRQQIRIIGGAVQPQGLAFTEHMTVLDVLIAIGGLNEFAAGNGTSIVRTLGDRQIRFGVRLEDLVKKGDISANVKMSPGDIIIIPEARF